MSSSIPLLFPNVSSTSLQRYVLSFITAPLRFPRNLGFNLSGSLPSPKLFAGRNHTLSTTVSLDSGGWYTVGALQSIREVEMQLQQSGKTGVGAVQSDGGQELVLSHLRGAMLAEASGKICCLS